MSSRSTCTDALLLAWMLIMTLLTANARAGVLEKALLPGELVAGHAKYELQCERCHERFDRAAQSQLCLACHKDVAQDVTAKQGLHGRQAERNCVACHTDHKGRHARITDWDPNRFDHAKTDFRLNGAHARAKCAGCHSAGLKYREAPRLCNDCHRRDDFSKGHKGRLGTKCVTCHNENDWKESVFDHDTTRFRLTGKHVDVKCVSCHQDTPFTSTPLACVGCHRKDDQAKGHQGRYGNKCEACHTDLGWQKLRFDHDRDTRYPLRGKHQEVRCDSCHRPALGLLYQPKKLPTACVACHRQDDQAKGHQGKLGDKCETCHSERAWTSSSFDHDKTTFPLSDKHRDAKCADCHTGGVTGSKALIKLGTNCVACHRKDDQAKGHKGRYGDKCDSCHTARDWKAERFDHDRDTRYALKGRHVQVKCDACHQPAFGAIHRHTLDSRCAACHRTDDKHKGQLGQRCENCHDETRWTGMAFDHNQTRFPLTGSHTVVACKKCHATPAFRDAPAACSGCHQEQDKHKGRYGNKCETCHRTGTWKAWDFDHGSTRFALDGGHARLACEACHTAAAAGPQTARNCVGCHERDDVHNGGFGMQCERCHVASDWKRYKR